MLVRPQINYRNWSFLDKNGNVYTCGDAIQCDDRTGVSYTVQGNRNQAIKLVGNQILTNSYLSTLERMIAFAPRLYLQGNFSWPICLLYKNDKVCGYLMSYREGFKPVSVIAGDFMLTKMHKLCILRNLCNVVAIAHRYHFSLGCLRPETVLVDSDSGQVFIGDIVHELVAGVLAEHSSDYFQNGVECDLLGLSMHVLCVSKEDAALYSNKTIWQEFYVKIRRDLIPITRINRRILSAEVDSYKPPHLIEWVENKATFIHISSLLYKLRGPLKGVPFAFRDLLKQTLMLRNANGSQIASIDDWDEVIQSKENTFWGRIVNAFDRFDILRNTRNQYVRNSDILTKAQSSSWQHVSVSQAKSFWAITLLAAVAYGFACSFVNADIIEIFCAQIIGFKLPYVSKIVCVKHSLSFIFFAPIGALIYNGFVTRTSDFKGFMRKHYIYSLVCAVLSAFILHFVLLVVFGGLVW